MSGEAVREAGDADFESAVVARSREVPVVVDFWAPWCAPCRQIGPVLERLAGEGAGRWALVKVNVDTEPKTAQAFRVRSIPAVKAFKDGRVVSEFVGAVPESQIRAWVSRLLPTEADLRAADAEAREKSGDALGALARYREALAEDADHPKGIVGLARLLADRGETDEALALLDRRPADTAVLALRARIVLARGGGADVDALRARVAASPKDASARYDLGRALAAAGDYEAALEELLEAVRLDRKLDDDGARKAMLDVFRLLGDDDDRTRSYRRKLSTAI